MSQTEQRKNLMEKRVEEIPRSQSVSSTGSQDGEEEVLSLQDLSLPPTEEELEKYGDLPLGQLPRRYKRDQLKRVFANRDVDMRKIKWFGWDMDYTLAMYDEEELGKLIYDATMARLVDMGYPDEILENKFDSSFPIRGLFVDAKKGNLLKVDMYSNIVGGSHGRTRLSKEELEEAYPSMFIPSTERTRFYLLNTMFNLPEACVFADLVEFVDAHKDMQSSSGGVGVSLKNVFADVRSAIDWVHHKNVLKKAVMEDMERFVKRSDDIALLLKRMKKAGASVFLLTNSEWEYTNAVMTYLLDGVYEDTPSWRDYFDIKIVGAKKPLWFGEGTMLREVDTENNTLSVSRIVGFEKEKVYNGGSLSFFEKLTGAKGGSVLYTGDHIYGDIIKSKQTHGWCTLLVVPELSEQIEVWRKSASLRTHLANLEFILAETMRGLDSEVEDMPDVSVLTTRIQVAKDELDAMFNPVFGGLMRSGSTPSFFATQMRRYADLYTPNYLNLLNYPLGFYNFFTDRQILSHEFEGEQ